MEMTQRLWIAVKARILQEAHFQREEAAYNGQMHDGGARSMERSVQRYEDGLFKRVPDDWECYVHEEEKESDPEYSEYLRLKNKFK